MPVSFHIVPGRDLSVVTYHGFAGIDETMAAAAAYARDPGYRPGQRQLFDFSRITGHERDFPKFFRLQGQLVEVYGRDTGHETLVACLVSGPASRALAEEAMRSWVGVAPLVSVMFDDEASALAFLGQPETRIADLFAPGAAAGRDGPARP